MALPSPAASKEGDVEVLILRAPGSWTSLVPGAWVILRIYSCEKVKKCCYHRDTSSKLVSFAAVLSGVQLQHRRRGLECGKTVFFRLFVYVCRVFQR